MLFTFQPSERKTAGVAFYLKLKNGEITEQDLEVLSALKEQSVQEYSSSQPDANKVNSFSNKYDGLITDARDRFFQAMKKGLMEENGVFQDKNSYLITRENELNELNRSAAAKISELKSDIQKKSKKIEATLSNLEPQASKPKINVGQEQSIPMPPPPPPPPAMVQKPKSNASPKVRVVEEEKVVAPAAINPNEIFSMKLRSAKEPRVSNSSESPRVPNVVLAEHEISGVKDKIQNNSLTTFEKSVIVTNLEAQQKEQNIIISQLTAQLKSLDALEDKLKEVEVQIQQKKEAAQKAEEVVSDFVQPSAPPPPPPPMMNMASKAMPLAKGAGKSSGSSVIQEEPAAARQEDLVAQELQEKMAKNQEHRLALDRMAEESALVSAEAQKVRIEEEKRKQAEKDEARKAVFIKYDKSESYNELQTEEKKGRFERTLNRIEQTTKNILREYQHVDNTHDTISKLETTIERLDNLLRNDEYLAMLQEHAQNDIIADEGNTDSAVVLEASLPLAETDIVDGFEIVEVFSEAMKDNQLHENSVEEVGSLSRQVDVEAAKKFLLDNLHLLELKWGEFSNPLKRDSAQSFIKFCNEIVPCLHEAVKDLVRAKQTNGNAEIGAQFVHLENHLEMAKKAGGTHRYMPGFSFHPQERANATLIGEELLAKVRFYSNALTVSQETKEDLRPG